MQKTKTIHRSFSRVYRFTVQLLLTGLFFLITHRTSAQCPPNIDFETGTFDRWICYSGSVANVNGQNVISLAETFYPVAGRQTMCSSIPGDGYDPYGGFPVNCPNGSGHSVKLGNNTGGAEAEGIAYEFTIPANRNTYNIIYYYAVVFQDPNHLEPEQPRMEIEIRNVTDGYVINCSSFTFYPFGSLLPGFYIGNGQSDDGSPVWCKDWSAVSINLDGMAGKTISLFFKTADCTFRRHFGYAYIDVNSECSGEFVGAAFCPDDTAINVVGPYGYQTYTWFNTAFTQVLGSGQVLTFNPPPPPGTTIAVELVPYNGYGCLDTLYARLLDTLTVRSNAGPDLLSCNKDPVQLGGLPKAGLVYTWTPAAGLSSANISNPLASPDITTTYILQTNHDGGGCISFDTAVVKASVINASMQLIGKDVFCAGFGDSAVLRVPPSFRMEWYRDGTMIPGANQAQYRVTQSGVYHAMLYNTDGCSIPTTPQAITVDRAREGIRYPVEYALENEPYILHARNFGNSAVWSPPTFLTSPNTYDPEFKGKGEQTYTIEIRTATGCITIDTQTVKTIDHVDIYVPKAFTPNGDGLNEFLRPVPMGVKQINYFRVYNRWGQLLYQSRTALPGWDGTVSGIKQGTQVVVWIAEGVGIDGRVYTRKGMSTLIR